MTVRYPRLLQTVYWLDMILHQSAPPGAFTVVENRSALVPVAVSSFGFEDAKSQG
jgi:hypothetical protein